MQALKTADKVTLLFEIDPLPAGDNSPNAISYEFIYGIGTCGLSPMERALTTKTDDDNIRIAVKTGEWEEFFGHLPSPAIDGISAAHELKITAKIISAAPAPNREVIQALANMTSCGGSCDCGCGGH